jgi:hypothetical protein
MGLRSGDCSLVATRSCGGGAVLEASLDGGGGAVVTGLLGGGGGGHTSYPVSGEIRQASLAPVCSARVPMGRPHGSIQIRVVCLYAGRGDVESGTDMTSIGSSSSSATATSTTSSSSVTPSSPSLILGDDNTGCLCATGRGHEPIPWMVQGISQQPNGVNWI